MQPEREPVAGNQRKDAIVNTRLVLITTLGLISERQLLQRLDVSWVQFDSAFKTASCFFPLSGPALHVTAELKNLGAVRQFLSSNYQLLKGAFIITRGFIVIIAPRRMQFAGIGIVARGGFKRRVRLLE